MSKSILNAILKGNLLPWEEKFINTPKFNELIEKIDQDRTYFENNLSPNEQCRFDQYTCLITELVQHKFNKYHLYFADNV